MRSCLGIISGKLVYYISKFLHLGAGSTWPGEIAMTISPKALSALSDNFRKGVLIVAGTNGKTTTSLMIKQILEAQRLKTIHNETGANLMNGIVSALVKHADWLGNIYADWGIFEVDENSLPLVIDQVKPKIIVLLNLFRDQLDRYGEVDVISEKWNKSLKNLSVSSTVILNVDDPQIAFLGKNLNAEVIYFGLNDKKLFLDKREHATDSIFCLSCGARLVYEGIYYSHIGIWKCNKCGEKRPNPNIISWHSPLPGLYNQYNTLAAVSVAKLLNISNEQLNQSLINFKPAFGRQEEFNIQGKKVKIFLSKNPAGFNQSLRTVAELGAKYLLLVLNDRIPDGRDVSWIWDVDFEEILPSVKVIVSGDRVFDLAVRIKYSLINQKSKIPAKQDSAPQDKTQSFDRLRIDPEQSRTGQKYNLKIKNRLIVEPELKVALKSGLNIISQTDTFYILATYSAMLEVRKLLLGRKIL